MHKLCACVRLPSKVNYLDLLRNLQGLEAENNPSLFNLFQQLTQTWCLGGFFMCLKRSLIDSSCEENFLHTSLEPRASAIQPQRKMRKEKSLSPITLSAFLHISCASKQ